MTNNKKLTQERNRDFIENCRQIMADNPSFPLADVLTVAINKRPIRYYFDYAKGMEIMERMMNKRSDNPYKGTLKRDMAVEFFCDTMRLMRSRNWPLSKAVLWVLMYRNPTGFYISYQTAYRITRGHLSNRCSERIN